MFGAKPTNASKCPLPLSGSARPTMAHSTTAASSLCQAHDAGNTENTIAFLKYLRSLDEQARLLIIWDGASYHRSHQLRQFLAEAIAGLPPEHWNIECIRFAPHAPEQNPVEDIWLQAKQFIRKFFMLCKSFAAVKYLFELVTHQQCFTFKKAFMYG
jgi:transposase